MEAADHSEPVSFYAPGAWGWADPMVKAIRGRLRAVLAEEVVPLSEDEVEEE